MAAEPMAHDIDEVGVFAEDDDVRHVVPGSPVVVVLVAEGIRPIVEVAVTAVDALDNMKPHGGRGMIVDGPVRPQFHTHGSVIIRLVVAGIVLRHIRGVPSGNRAGVPLEVRFDDFMNFGVDTFLINYLLQLLHRINIAATCHSIAEKVKRWLPCQFFAVRVKPIS